jgi:hypothetical protein
MDVIINVHVTYSAALGLALYTRGNDSLCNRVSSLIQCFYAEIIILH